MALSSWSCDGCTNICYRMVNGETFRYCRAFIEKGKNRAKWQGDHVTCRDYTQDPAKEDPVVRWHDCMMGR